MKQENRSHLRLVYRNDTIIPIPTAFNKETRYLKQTEVLIGRIKAAAEAGVPPVLQGPSLLDWEGAKNHLPFSRNNVRRSQRMIFSSEKTLSPEPPVTESE